MSLGEQTGQTLPNGSVEGDQKRGSDIAARFSRSLEAVDHAAFSVLADESVKPEFVPKVVIEGSGGYTCSAGEINDVDTLEAAAAEFL